MKITIYSPLSTFYDNLLSQCLLCCSLEKRFRDSLVIRILISHSLRASLFAFLVIHHLWRISTHKKTRQDDSYTPTLTRRTTFFFIFALFFLFFAGFRCLNPDNYTSAFASLQGAQFFYVDYFADFFFSLLTTKGAWHGVGQRRQ